MLKSQIENFNEYYSPINQVATIFLGDNDWDIKSDITNLAYHGDDDEIEFMEATIQTKIVHNSTCLVIETMGGREMFGSNLGNFDFINSNANIYTARIDTEPSSYEPVNRDLIPDIHDSDINASNLILFVTLPTPPGRATTFKGTDSTY